MGDEGDVGQEDKGSTGAFVFDHFWRSCVNGTIFHASIKIYEYWCVTQELERQVAATCKARQMRLETGQVSSLRARVSRRKRKRISAQTDRQKLNGTA